MIYSESLSYACYYLYVLCLLYAVVLRSGPAPRRVLGMKVLDELIGDELNYYKDELKTGGLSALIGN